MNTATLTVPRPNERSWTQAARIALAALAIAVLLVVAFALGRTTVSTAKTTTFTPATGVHSSLESCHIGRPC